MSKLENNTINLQSILNTVNNLPSAESGSSGGSVETCTVYFTNEGPDVITYTDKNFNAITLSLQDAWNCEMVEVVKGSLLYIEHSFAISDDSDFSALYTNRNLGEYTSVFIISSSGNINMGPPADPF